MYNFYSLLIHSSILDCKPESCDFFMSDNPEIQAPDDVVDLRREPLSHVDVSPEHFWKLPRRDVCVNTDVATFSFFSNWTLPRQPTSVMSG